MPAVTAGTFVRWIDPRPGAKPLGIVLAPVGEEMILVLMADHEGNTDVEAFLARPADTGVDASEMVLKSMEIAEEVDPALVSFLHEQAARFEADIGG